MRTYSAVTIFIAVMVGVIVGLGAYTFIYAKGYAYLTDDPQACTNCHVMQVEYDAWLKSSHHSVATCNDCHTPRNILGKYAIKANNGFWHSFYFTSGKYPDTIEITKFDHKVAENACRRCHDNITAQIEPGAVHGNGDRLECTRCHDSVGHSEAASAQMRSFYDRSHHDQD